MTEPLLLLKRGGKRMKEGEGGEVENERIKGCCQRQKSGEDEARGQEYMQ